MDKYNLNLLKIDYVYKYNKMSQIKRLNKMKILIQIFSYSI
jgi:hypothetical protein